MISHVERTEALKVELTNSNCEKGYNHDPNLAYVILLFLELSKNHCAVMKCWVKDKESLLISKGLQGPCKNNNDL